MQNAKPRLALAIGILCISIFPILVKLNLTPGLISAFYRMAFSFAIILPIALFSDKFKMPPLKYFFLSLLCGVLFGSDVAVWNIAIQESSATQASLLTNLSQVWVGIASFLFLSPKPKTNFWIHGNGGFIFCDCYVKLFGLGASHVCYRYESIPWISVCIIYLAYCSSFCH